MEIDGTSGTAIGGSRRRSLPIRKDTAGVTKMKSEKLKQQQIGKRNESEVPYWGACAEVGGPNGKIRKDQGKEGKN